LINFQNVVEIIGLILINFCSQERLQKCKIDLLFVFIFCKLKQKQNQNEMIMQ